MGLGLGRPSARPLPSSGAAFKVPARLGKEFSLSGGSGGSGVAIGGPAPPPDAAGTFGDDDLCLNRGDAGIGLLVCDEGHRLKAAQGNRTIEALRRLSRRRVILTGTPLQNDLGEFWALCDFVAPGELGEQRAFNGSIAAPIDAGRQPNASEGAREAAEMARERLRRLTEPFVQRRESSLLSTLLPPRAEMALFVRLSPSQLEAYRAAADDGRDSDNVLATITHLRKICSHADTSGGPPLAPPSTDACCMAKLDLLMRLLAPIRDAGEQVVICSCFNRSLDMLQAALDARGWGALRLDGTTGVEQRQDLVDRFNGRGCREFAFLLATRAGGSGFNLVGASRLILFDPDWNPAMDTQAMGRVYREGQTRHVHVWRLLHAGTIEEKIYMRQLFKKGLNGLVKEGGGGGGPLSTTADDTFGCSDDAELRQGFDREELRQLFDLDASGRSSTLTALLGGREAAASAMCDGGAWIADLPDPLLRQALETDVGVRDALSFASNVAALERLRDDSDATIAAASQASSGDRSDDDDESGVSGGRAQLAADESDADDVEAEAEAQRRKQKRKRPRRRVAVSSGSEDSDAE